MAFSLGSKPIQRGVTSLSDTVYGGQTADITIDAVDLNNTIVQTQTLNGIDSNGILLRSYAYFVNSTTLRIGRERAKGNGANIAGCTVYWDVIEK